MRIAEAVFAVVSLVLLTDAADVLVEVFLAVTARPFGIPIKRLPLLPTFAISVFLLVRGGGATRALLREAWPLVALVALAALSILWSAVPDVTATWSVALAGTTMFGLVLALRFSPERQLRVVALALAIVVAVSALTLLVPPELRRNFGMRSSGAVGLFYDRNLFGRVAALLALASGLLALGSPALRVPALLGCAAGVGWLGATRSLTPSIALAAAATVTILLCGAARLSSPLRRRVLAGATAFGIIAASTVAMMPEPFLAAVGRDPTLTGRTPIWAKEIAAIHGRPIFGYGYAAFWPSPDAPTGERGNVRSGHNGLLDLWVELGWTGGLLFLIPAGVYARRAVAHGLTGGGLALWPAAYLAFFFTLNLAESVMVKHKIFWALYVAAALWPGTTDRPTVPRPSAVAIPALHGAHRRVASGLPRDVPR